jgi:hypothetical protein
VHLSSICSSASGERDAASGADCEDEGSDEAGANANVDGGAEVGMEVCGVEWEGELCDGR